MSRVLFVTDPHGADAVLEKSFRAIREYEVSLYILAGDLSAKDIRPIVRVGDGRYLADRGGRHVELAESDVGEIERLFSSTGHYHFRCSPDELEDLKANEDRVVRLIDEKTLEKLAYWADQILASVDFRKTRVLMTPGNDDLRDVDDLLRQLEDRGIHSHINQPVSIGANEVVSLDYSNPTPWHTPREVTESELSDKIEELVQRLARPDNAIFNFHCPPRRTKLDLAPELDGNLKPVVGLGAIRSVHVGSSAVRTAIERHQPVLGLHGHIHESPGEETIGRTVCLNPGSEYFDGTMHAYIIELSNDGNVASYHRIQR